MLVALPGLLTAVLILALGKYQLKAKPVEIQGRLQLKLDSTFGLIGAILITLGVSLPFLFKLNINPDPGLISTDMLIMLIISAAFVAIGFWTLLVFKNHYVLYDDTEIVVVGLNRKKQSFTWAEISDLTFNAWSNNYILTLKSGEKVKIYKYLKGSNDFIKRTGKR
jgi:hypothetical protein